MEIRYSTEDDQHAIRELFRLAFGKELSREEWIWKYRSSPWGSHANVAVKDGVLIAHYGGLKFECCQGSKQYTVYEICDVMSHPRYRAHVLARRGAMVRTAELYESTIPMDFAFGFPSERHARLGTIQLGIAQHRYIRLLSKKISVSWLRPAFACWVLSTIICKILPGVKYLSRPRGFASPFIISVMALETGRRLFRIWILVPDR